MTAEHSAGYVREEQQTKYCVNTVRSVMLGVLFQGGLMPCPALALYFVFRASCRT